MAAPTTPPPVNLPPWLKFAVALAVVGGVAELIYKINPTASYLFVLVVIFGFAAVGTNLSNINTFLASVRNPGG